MAMNVAALTSLIENKTATKLAQVNPDDFDTPAAYGDAMNHAASEAIAEAIIEHIQSAAQVLPGIAVTTAGSPTNHTGTTTAPGVIQ